MGGPNVSNRESFETLQCPHDANKGLECLEQQLTKLTCQAKKLQTYRNTRRKVDIGHLQCKRISIGARSNLLPIGQLVLGLVRAPGHDLGIKKSDDGLLELLTEGVTVGLLTKHNGAFFGCCPATKTKQETKESEKERDSDRLAQCFFCHRQIAKRGNRLARLVRVVEHLVISLCGGRASNVVP